MDLFDPILHTVNVILNLFSIIVLVWGVVKAAIDFFRSEIRFSDRIKAAKMNNFIKNYLGTYVLLSLEILIAADIIESIINPTFNDILKLGIVVIIRTVISYFLHKEIEESSDQSEDSLLDDRKSTERNEG